MNRVQSHLGQRAGDDSCCQQVVVAGGPLGPNAVVTEPVDQSRYAGSVVLESKVVSDDGLGQRLVGQLLGVGYGDEPFRAVVDVRIRRAHQPLQPGVVVRDTNASELLGLEEAARRTHVQRIVTHLGLGVLEPCGIGSAGQRCVETVADSLSARDRGVVAMSVDDDVVAVDLQDLTAVLTHSCDAVDGHGGRVDGDLSDQFLTVVVLVLCLRRGCVRSRMVLFGPSTFTSARVDPEADGKQDEEQCHKCDKALSPEAPHS